jgi:hypothetical protein
VPEVAYKEQAIRNLLQFGISFKIVQIDAAVHHLGPSHVEPGLQVDLIYGRKRHDHFDPAAEAFFVTFHDLPLHKV